MTNSTSHKALRLALQRRFDIFVGRVFPELHNGTPLELTWLIMTMAWHINEVMHGRIRRLIINVPPRHLKSIVSSVAFPAFQLGQDPSHRIVIICYSKELAEKMMRDIRQVMNSKWYRELFPDVVLISQTREKLITSNNGIIQVTSVGGTLLGFGADTIIVDDPINAEDASSEAERRRTNDWFRSTMFGRLNNLKTGRIMVTMQRLHEEDVTGMLTENAKHGWSVLSVPAVATVRQTYPLMHLNRITEYVREAGTVIDPTRQGHEEIDNIKRDQGSLVFSAQYQQEPLPREGNLIKREWLQYYDRGEDTRPYDAIVVAWDTASAAKETNDYSVCTVWGIRGQDYYLIRLYRERLSYPLLKQRAAEIFSRHNAQRILIENADSGRMLQQDLKQVLNRMFVIPITPRGSKEDRVAAISAIVEERRVYLPRDTDWVPPFLNELLGFPRARYDDQVDSFTLFLNWMRQRPGQTLVIGDSGRISFRRQRPNRLRLRGL